MPLKDVINDKFGLNTRSITNRLLNTIGVTVAQVLPHDPNRLSWTVINLGANNVYIHSTRDVSATQGILLTPNGGSVTMTWEYDFDLVGYEVWGISAGAGNAIYTIEIVEG